MGRTSAKVKNAYNARNYDRINLTIPKGLKELWQSAAQKAGLSLNAYITEAVEARRAGAGFSFSGKVSPSEGNSRFISQPGAFAEPADTGGNVAEDTTAK